jgi:pheromone shutdown protein TraB
MIRLLGTSHISPNSIRRIKEEIRSGVDCVAVELDLARYKSLKYGKEDRPPSIFFRLFSWLQKRLGEKTGVFPGEEMLRAVESSKEHGIDTYLIDQDISKTIKDFEEIGITDKLKLILSSLFFTDARRFDLRDVPSYDLVEASLEHIRKHSPKFYEILVEKRNIYMSEAIKELDRRYDEILVVVGIGHVPGIKEILEEENLSFVDTGV